ncbi:hypothetical protein ACFL2Q_03750 [Thermodesulfobacteriota bacterium]
MMNEEATRNLVSAISEGRACLLLGQDHTEGLVGNILKEISALTSTPVASLPEALSNVGIDTLAASMAEYLLSRSVPLLELTSLPWSSVVSTAVDRGLLDALTVAGTTRRLVEVTAERIALTTGAHSPATLHLFQVLGRVDAPGDLAPPDAETLPGKLLLKLPRALDSLPQLLGTRGVLVIEGMASNAWLDDVSWAAFEQVLRKVPLGRTYWFGWAPARLREKLAESIYFVESRLTKAIAAWASDKDLSACLTVGRETVFGIDDHICTVGVARSRKTARFSAKDWRQLLRVGSVIDDAELDRLCTWKSDTRLGGLVGFVRRAHVGVPDWDGAARGYCFPRDATDKLIDAVVEYLSSPKISLLDPSGGGVMRRPVFVSGPPAIGKSVGLLYLAWELRRTHRVFVLWLLPGLSGLDPVQVERVCRMAEARGVPWTVLIVDGALPEECTRLLDKLLSDGRRVILIGTETAFADARQMAPGYSRFQIALALGEREVLHWSSYLEKHGIEDRNTDGRDFLNRLHTALPECGYGSTAALLQEYERVIRSAKQAREQSHDDEGPLAQQLRELFPHLVRDSDPQQPEGRFEADPLVRDLIELILFCARAELPVSTDTLFVLLGSDLLNSFGRLREAFERTALIQEVEMDNEGTIALTTAHRLHAQWLLRAIRPAASSQLDVLRNLVNRVPWDLDAYPGDNPIQDYAIRLLRQVGPRGGAADDFSSIPALKALTEVLATIWRTYGKGHPGLLTLEAIIRGDIAKRDTESPVDERLHQCGTALDLLDAAVEVLRSRHPSEARSFELQRALTLAADIRGTQLNILLRESSPSRPEVHRALEELQADVMMARSYDTKYHPLDILYWANRDARNLLANGGVRAGDFDAELLATMQMALEVAEEEQIVDEEQRSRLDGRRVELDQIVGATPLASERAAEMRARGNFAGELVLSRIAVDERQRHPTVCREELERILGFGPAVLTDVRVLRYLCRLWIDAWAGPDFGKDRAVCCPAPAAAWERLLHIARARLSMLDDAEHPLTTFLLGWAQLQLGDPGGARKTFTLLERRSIGMRRRIGELAVVSKEDGHPRPFVARVQTRKAERVLLRVDGLAEVLEMRPEVELIVAPSGLQIGEVTRIAIALNYRGLQIKALTKA